VSCANELTQEKAFDVAAATFVAHPEVEYWFCTNCLELYSQGVARAVESLQNEDKVLIIDVGSDILCSEWDNSYDGSWIACMAISNFQYTAPTICGLVAMIDGVATPESLWVDQRAPGDKCTFFVTDNMIVTRDTYQEYFNKYAQLAEAPLPYPDN
jgi:ABC-type sugar transport system substrate-binding protein